MSIIDYHVFQKKFDFLLKKLIEPCKNILYTTLLKVSIKKEKGVWR